MKTSNWKFFVGIGLLITIAGILLYANDPLIAFLAVTMGIYNIVKGVRLRMGIQPYLIRKQQEREKALKNEVQEKIKSANQQRNKK